MGKKMRKYYILLLISLLFSTSSYAAAGNCKKPICNKEKNYLAKRERLIRQNNKTLPRIGLAFSGGGHRSMISTLGFIKQAKKLGLLDQISYVSMLSGSTWMGTQLLTRKINSSFESYQAFQKYFKTVLNRPFISLDLLKQAFKIRPDFTYIYSFMLVHHIFSDDITLSQGKFSDLLAAPANFPFPIFIASIDTSKCFKNGASKSTNDIAKYYEFVNVCPCCIWSDVLGEGIKTARMEKMLEGKYTEEASTIGYFLSIFGSAYSASLKDLIRSLQYKIFALLDKKGVKKTYSDKIKRQIEKIWGYTRIFPPRMPNYTSDNKFGVKDFPVIDGGYISSLPISPLLQRDCKIIICVDASGNGSKGKLTELQKFADYAKRKEMPFPALTSAKPYQFIDPETKLTHEMKVFGLDNPNVPTIIYLQNRTVFSTIKFNYSEAEFDSLANYIEKTLKVFADDIELIIKKKSAS
jgi:hypothetical protein